MIESTGSLFFTFYNLQRDTSKLKTDFLKMEKAVSFEMFVCSFKQDSLTPKKTVD